MITPEQIKQYEGKSIHWLVGNAQLYFNKYIRERDKNSRCISCDNGKPEQAGHYFSAGHHQALRFNEMNCWGQCLRCNHFLRGNLINYRLGLLIRIGEAKLTELENLAAYYKRTGFKHDRLSLIETIITYRNKLKTTNP